MRNTRKKSIFCAECGHEHYLQERLNLKQCSYTVCPECEGESYVDNKRQYLKLLDARKGLRI